MIQSYTEIAIKNLQVSFSILQTEFIHLKHTLNAQITEWVLFPNDNNVRPKHGSQIESMYTNLLAFGWMTDLHSTPLAINL